jgi:hypothetical protein
VAGFESTGYAWLGPRLVWAGGASHSARTEHPRSLHRPWQPPVPAGDARALRRGARLALEGLPAWPARGLLPWVAGGDLPFPLQLARTRFDALRQALEADDAAAFAAAAPRVLGLGPGLTPSGDDFLGAVFFALAHAPRRGWAAMLPALEHTLLQACGHSDQPNTQPATNPISAALLADLMRGRGYRVLHEWLSALQGGERAALASTGRALLALGASSGADLMSGVLLTLASTPETDLLPHPCQHQTPKCPTPT